VALQIKPRNYKTSILDILSRQKYCATQIQCEKINYWEVAGDVLSGDIIGLISYDNKCIKYH
jgi:hypothetical protein